ncbi:MAG TPA: phage holin family protein [Paenalcaligenes sp.]|nr:phage holin family protein [Paenalcaligenes sp.]
MSLRQKVGQWSQTLVAILATRLELFAIEFSEEKGAFIRMLVWVAAAMFFGVLAIIVLTFLLILLFWPTEWRYWAFAAILIIYSGLSLYFARKVIVRLTRGPIPFQASLDELKQDLHLIQRLREDVTQTDQADPSENRPL